jgi:hypothetical protein
VSWVKLDDQFFANPKVIELPKDAKLLYIAGLTYCAAQLTDGLISPAALRMVAAMVQVNTKQAAALVTAGLWEREGDGYLVHDYLEYNPSGETVRAERAAARERMRRVRSADVRPNIGRSSPSPSPSPSPIESLDKEREKETTARPESSLSRSAASQETTAPEDRPIDEAGFALRMEDFERQYPQRYGKAHSFTKARRLLRALPAKEWPQMLLAVRNYASGDLARDGPTHNPENFVANEWRAWAKQAPQQNGASANGHATAVTASAGPGREVPTPEEAAKLGQQLNGRIAELASRTGRPRSREPGAA